MVERDFRGLGNQSVTRGNHLVYGSTMSQADPLASLFEHLTALYGSAVARKTLSRLTALTENYRARINPHTNPLSERDAILITYPDQVREPNTPPLATLADFCAKHLDGVVSGIHILPFYPFTSDDGFSVVDYRSVNPEFGTWKDIERISTRFRLMLDAVINHVSASSAWFQGFVRDDPRYRDYFIVVANEVDLSRVVRPRTLPLLTTFTLPRGEKNVWTTFSTDQIDLNYHNPDVLLDVLDTLLFYVSHRAEFIRLDAIAYLWKEIGTTCINLPQTHHVIQLVRAVMDSVAPHVKLITETNVPHADNISYFGDGLNEAQLVYNFALPPLVLHAFHTGSAATLSRWASELTLPSKQVTFFNFLASHDGIGLNPVRGILSNAEIDALVVRAQAHRGLVSYKANSAGTNSAYELNAGYFDALSDPNADESLDTQVTCFITAQAIMLSLVGVPGIYFHSMFGSRGWLEGVAATGQNRAINREKFERAVLERELAEVGSRRRLVFTRYSQLLHARAAHPAFDPYGTMRILAVNSSIFAVLRIDSHGGSVLCLHNVSHQPQNAELNLQGVFGGESHGIVDLITDHRFSVTEALHLTPYQSLWLTSKA